MRPSAIAALLTLAALGGCRERARLVVGPTPREERLEELRDAPPRAVDASPDADAVASAPDDPCAGRGPWPGEPCDQPGLVCLALVQSGMNETRCLAGRWESAPAAPLPAGPKGSCPAAPPRSGAPCSGAATCPFGPCSEVDPSTGTLVRRAFAEVWTCYLGAWRRYDEYCLGE